MLNISDLDLDEQSLLRTVLLEAIDYGNAEEATRLLIAYEEEFGQDETWYLANIDIALMKSNTEAMIQALNEAVGQNLPENELNLRFGKFFYLVGRPLESIDYLNACSFREGTEEDFQRIYFLGCSSMLEGLYEQALSCMEDILLESTDARYYLLASLCYEKAGRHERAVEYMKHVIDHRNELSGEIQAVLTPYHFDVFELLENADDLCSILIGKKSPQSIVNDQMDLSMFDQILDSEDFCRMLSRDLGHSLSHENIHMLRDFFKGLYYEQLKQEKEARKQFRKILDHQPSGSAEDRWVAIFFKLCALDHLGYASSTLVKYIKSYADQFQNFVPILVTLANFAGSKGLKSAVRYLYHSDRSNVLMDENYHEYRYVLGQALYCVEMFSEACDVFDSVYSKYQEDPEYMKYLLHSAIASRKDPVLLKVSEQMMPDGEAAVALIDYYERKNCHAKAQEIVSSMEKAIQNPDIQVENLSFYYLYLNKKEAVNRESLIDNQELSK